MIDQYLLIWVMAVHFFADFTCQPHYLAINKSSNVWALTAHIAIYATLLYLLLIPTGLGLTFVLANAILHWLTDFVSSKFTSKFYKAGRIKAFWNIIALDQFIHVAGLILLIK